MIKLFSSIFFVDLSTISARLQLISSFEGIHLADISLYQLHKYPHALLSIRIVKERLACLPFRACSSRGAHSTAFSLDVNSFLRFTLRCHFLQSYPSAPARRCVLRSGAHSIGLQFCVNQRFCGFSKNLSGTDNYMKYI